MNDRSPEEEMIAELGLDPALDVESDQRADLLRRWHEEDAQREREQKER